jgi:hypothetical protein
LRRIKKPFNNIQIPKFVRLLDAFEPVAVRKALNIEPKMDRYGFTCAIQGILIFCL